MGSSAGNWLPTFRASLAGVSPLLSGQSGSVRVIDPVEQADDRGVELDLGLLGLVFQLGPVGRLVAAGLLQHPGDGPDAPGLLLEIAEAGTVAGHNAEIVLLGDIPRTAGLPGAAAWYRG